VRSPVDGLLGTGLCRWLGRGATVARCCHEFATCGDHCPTPVEREKYVAAKRNAPARCGGSDAPGFRYRAAQQHSGSGLCRRSSGKLQKQIAEALILLPQPFLEGDHRHNHGERVAADLAVFPPRPSAHLGKFLFGAMNQQPGSLHFLGNTTPLQKYWIANAIKTWNRVRKIVDFQGTPGLCSPTSLSNTTISGSGRLIAGTHFAAALRYFSPRTRWKGLVAGHSRLISRGSRESSRGDGERIERLSDRELKNGQ